MGLYSGFRSSLIGEMLGTGLGFMTYETGNQWWERTHGHKPTPAQKGAIGAASAMVVMTSTMPLELIQRRMQVAAALASGHAFAYAGPLDAFAQICRKEGFRTFYRGSAFAYAKVVPSIGAMYMLYDLSSQALAIGGLRRYHRDAGAKQSQRSRATARRQRGDPAAQSGSARGTLSEGSIPVRTAAAAGRLQPSQP